MTGISTLATTLARIDTIKDQNKLLNTLSTQMTSGKKTNIFAGLGSDALTSQRARANFSSIEIYQKNITIADTRIKLMLTAIEEFKAQAENFSSAILGLSQQSAHEDGDIVIWDDPTTLDVEENIRVGANTADMDVDFKTLQDLAGNMYDFMVDLVNADEAGRYLLNGADTRTKPLKDNGALDAAMSNLLNTWKTDNVTDPATLNANIINAITGRTATASNPYAITDTIVGYSADLTQGNVGNVFVRVSENSEIEYTALGNDQSFRDILVGLSFMKNANLGPIADAYQEPYTQGDTPIANGAPGSTYDEMQDNFYEVYNAVASMVENAINDIDRMIADLEGTRARLGTIKNGYTEQKNALVTTISDVEDVDTNEVAVKITAMQVQLDASYRVTALLQDLSLTNYFR